MTTQTNGGNGKNGILKDTNRPKPEKKRSITFPEYEELQEIIGYGGECYYSSSGDEDDDSTPPPPNNRRQQSAGKSGDSLTVDEMTPEERSIMNLTRQNTTFNSHAQNLRDGADATTTAVKLGHQVAFFLLRYFEC